MGRNASSRKTGLLAVTLGAVIMHPTASMGTLVMSATAVAILANALAFQHGMHPAPLFVGTRPAATAEPSAARRPQPAAAQPASLPGAADSIDHGLVADIQQGLKDFGYYKGEVDGLAGPQTSQAILAFERAFHLAPTGEASDNVLVAIRSVRQKLSDGGPAAAQSAVDPITVSTLPPGIPLPPPRPAPDRQSSVTPTTATATASPAASPTPSIGDLIASLGTAPAPHGIAAAKAPPTVVQPAVARVAAATPSAPTSTADTGDPRLARIQQSLAAQGFGPLDVNGRMTPETRDAIRRFETYYDLPITGAISETFLAQLVKVGGLQAN